MVKCGFVEMLDDENIYIVFEDKTHLVSKRKDINCEVVVDMKVIYEKGVLIFTKPDEELKKEIEELTSKLFVKFDKTKQKRKKHV